MEPSWQHWDVVDHPLFVYSVSLYRQSVYWWPSSQDRPCQVCTIMGKCLMLAQAVLVYDICVPVLGYCSDDRIPSIRCYLQSYV